MVLYRLKTAYGFAKLLALTGVLHRDIDHALCKPQSLRCTTQRAAIQAIGE